MSTTTSRSQLIGRRAELLAELFLQELEPAFISRPTTQDLGYDLLVGFPNERSGINTFAVQIKATEKPPGSRIAIPRSVFDRITHSNLPGLLLVADVKQNRLYYGWLKSNNANNGGQAVQIPIAKADETAKKELGRQLKNADLAAATAE